MEKLYLKNKLIEALAQTGITTKSVGYRWILQREKEGRLKLPRSPISNYRMMTEKQINEVIKEFSPGGDGKWIYTK